MGRASPPRPPRPPRSAPAAALLSAVLSAVLLAGCSLAPGGRAEDPERGRDAYPDLVRGRRESLAPAEYGAFLAREIDGKERELAQLGRQQEEARARTAFHQAGIDERRPHGVARFRARSGAIGQERLARRRRLLERELFFLRSQLAALPARPVRRPPARR